MLVAKEPWRFGKPKTHHIVLQEVIKQFLAAAVQIHDAIDKMNIFICKVHLCANIQTGAKGSNQITLILLNQTTPRSHYDHMEARHQIYNCCQS